MPEKKEARIPIPVPDNFPISWEDPSDAERTWHWEYVHSPEPAPALGYDFWKTVVQGMGKSTEHYGAPRRPIIRRINTYVYMSNRLVVDPDDVDAADKRAKEAAVAVGQRLKTFWNEEVITAIQDNIRFWDGFDLAAASPSELYEHIQESWVRLGQVWALHFRLGAANRRADEKFGELYKELFESKKEESDPFERLKLTQGFPCKTVEMGSELWKLGELAVDTVRGVLATTEPSLAGAALASTEGGTDFLKSLAGFLERFGHRGRHWGIEYPTWIEDPSPVFETLKSYIANPDRHPDRHFEERTVERERAVAEVRERLKGYPAPVQKRFNELLDIAQFGAILKEDHNFWIDFSCSCRVRRVMREAGHRLVSMDAIDTIDDVFHLHVDECLQSLVAPTDHDRRSVIAERRGEIEHFATILPPSPLGSKKPPDEDQPEKPKPPDEPGVLKGQAGSAGTIRGTARIVENPSAPTLVVAGDILVAGSTAPSLAPLFAIAGGIVTESGGLLSHCAIVAREYRIPAVVGVKNARTLISEGQLIEIDGTEGTVRLVKD